MVVFLKSVFLMLLTVYLVGLGFMLPAINNELNTDNQINYTAINKNLPIQSEANMDCDCGTITCAEYQLIYDRLPEGCNNAVNDNGRVTLISTIAGLPLWFNTIFIVLPFIMWIILIVLMFMPV